MNKIDKIALRRLHCWIERSSLNLSQPLNLSQRKVFELELGQLGYRIGNLDRLISISPDEFLATITVLEEMRGADVKYVPLFSRFPDDVPNDGEYLARRILGFFGLDTFADMSGFGADAIAQMQREDLWQKAIEMQAQRLNDSHTEWIILTFVSRDEAEGKLKKWVLDLVYSTTPIKEALWEDLLTLFDRLRIEIDLEKIRVKETLARCAAWSWQKLGKIVVKTPTDLLRMFAFLRAQDVSLAQPVDLKGLKLSKPQRREIVGFLNTCPALPEDLLRYKRLWISLSRWLHPGDFAKRFPAVAKAFDDLRNDRIVSFASSIVNSPPNRRIDKLLPRPSLFLRQLTRLLQDCEPDRVAASILSLQDRVDRLPLPLLMSAYCAVRYEGNRAVINKQGKPYAIGKRKPLGEVSSVLEAIDTLILTQLRGTKPWKRVWIDEAIDKLVLPLQARKQSDGLLNLGRGSRIALTEPVIRLFVYWQQSTHTTDLDLSAMKLDDNFQFAGHVAWNHYGSSRNIVHSGDIQSAPMGAAEFIDFRLAYLKSGYILPSILQYAGEKFSQLKACYAGWMNRQEVGGDRQTFDAKTVSQKVNANRDSRTWIPFLLDIAAREIIYVDLYVKGDRMVEKNEHFPLLAAALASFSRAKPTFGMLARWYVRANNATLVPKEAAETTIGTCDECSIDVLKLVGEGVTSF